MARRRLDRAAMKAAILAELPAARTQKAAAERVGVHAVTVIRWRTADTAFDAAVRALLYPVPDLADLADLDPPRRRPAGPLPPPGFWGRSKPSVETHPGCPKCGGKAVVRKTSDYTETRIFGVAFWTCAKACGWASWRPRHPIDCPACNGPRFWAASRKSVHCPKCGVRTPAGEPAAMAPKLGSLACNNGIK